MGLQITTAERNNRSRQEGIPMAFLLEVRPVIK